MNHFSLADHLPSLSIQFKQDAEWIGLRADIHVDQLFALKAQLKFLGESLASDVSCRENCGIDIATVAPDCSRADCPAVGVCFSTNISHN